MHIRRETSLARRIKPPADTSRFQRMETSGVEYRRDGSTEDPRIAMKMIENL